jgi:anti-anti-sigma factor
MASNFGIAIDKKGYDFVLKLEGDFDVTSAYELIYAIKKLSEETVTISIYTNGLKSISPSGLDVFHRHMMPLNSLSTKIVLTGDNASKLSLSNFSTLS